MDITSNLITGRFALGQNTKDTLNLELWVAGMRLAKARYLQEGSSTVLTRIATVGDPVARALLKELPEVARRKRDSLLVHYARHLVDGDTLFKGFPATAPVGIDTQKVVQLALVYAVSKQVPLSNLGTSWLLGIDTSSLHVRIKELVASGRIPATDTVKAFPPYPVRVVAPIAVGDLIIGKTLSVGGVFVGDSGLAKLSWRIVQNGTDRSSGFRASFTNTPDGKVRSWDVSVDGGFRLEATTASTGKYELVVWMVDGRERSDTSRTTFEVRSAPDTEGPSISWLNPTESKVYENSDSLLEVRIKVWDPSGIDSVRIGDSAVAPVDSICRRVVVVPVSDAGLSVRVRARDKAGNAKTDSVKVFRKAPPKSDDPRISLRAPVSGTVVPFETSSVQVEWMVVDPAKSVDSVTIGVIRASRKDDSVYSAVVALAPTGAPSVIQLKVHSGSKVFTDVVQVTRRADAEAPFISWLNPVESKVYENGDSLLEVRVKVWDPSGIDSVRIGDSTVAVVDSICRRVLLIPVSDAGLSVRVRARDKAGNAKTDSVKVFRKAPKVVGAAVATLLEPATRSGTVLPFDSTGATARWRLVDREVGVDDTTVRIGGVRATKENDSTWSARVAIPPNGLATVVTLEARNKANLSTSDFFSVARQRDTIPPKLSTASKSLTVPFDSATTTVSWTVTDNHKLGKVRIQGTEVAGLGSVYGLRVSLPIGTTRVGILATDSSGNESTDTVAIVRRTDTVKAVVANDANTALRAGTFWVKLTCATPGAKIHYTLDGSVPTESSLLFVDSIRIDTSLTLKARGFASPREAGPVLELSYKLALPVAVWGGGDHTLVLMGDHSLWGFGNNARNAFAAGATSIRSRPVKIADSVAQASAGMGFSMWVKLDGTLWGIGRNDSGALGIGTNADVSVPTRITQGVRKVFALFDEASLFIKTDGSLWGAGNNRWGQLGIGNRMATNLPIKIASDAIAAGGGAGAGYFLTSTGGLWTMGAPFNGRLGTPGDSIRTRPALALEGVEIISRQYGQSQIVGKADGTLWAFGWNPAGILATGDSVDVALPKKISFSRKVQQIEFGSDFALLLAVDGTLWATGVNANKALGSSPSAQSSVPTQILTDISAIATGFSQSFAITSDGCLFAAGSNEGGQLGLGTRTSAEGFSRVRF